MQYHLVSFGDQVLNGELKIRKGGSESSDRLLLCIGAMCNLWYAMSHVIRG